MIILALDTTSEFGSLALRSNGVTIAEHQVYSREGFAHLIFQAIDRICRESEVRFAEIDCFAAASGPGSFTGVRVGLSAVKGLAEALGKAAVGISNLRALSSFGKLRVRAVAMDTRRGDVYAAVYDWERRPVIPDSTANFSVWLEALSAPVDEFVFPRASAGLQDLLRATRFATLPVTTAPDYLAAAVAVCAEKDGLQGSWTDPAAVDANYVREFSAREQ